MTMRTIKSPARPGIGRGLALGLACCSALAACAPSSDSSSPGTGGATAPAGTGGASNSSGGSTVPAGSGGDTFPTSSGGATVPISSGGSGSGGSPDLSGSGGSLAAGSGGAPGSGGAGPAGGAKATGGSPAGGSSGSVGGSGSGDCAGVFCDGFEGGMTLGSAWTVDKGAQVAANVVEVVSTMKHSGNNSVHMHFTTNNGETFIHHSMGFPIAMNSLWGRVWLYIMNDPSSAGHDVYIEAAGMLSPQTGVRPLNTQPNMSINVTPGINGGEDGPKTSMPIPRGAWTCFEWHIATTSGTTGSVTLYVGGTQIATVAATKIPMLMFERVGYEHYAADKAVGDMWIDDYAMGTTRQNCM